MSMLNIHGSKNLKCTSPKLLAECCSSGDISSSLSIYKKTFLRNYKHFNVNRRFLMLSIKSLKISTRYLTLYGRKYGENKLK